jgi:WD40 repeat protein/DNA-binding winged helix-turn-helix (wHTH) protein
MMSSIVYSFGDFRIDRAKRVLLRRGQRVIVSPKCLDLLGFLLDNRNRLVEKDELLQRVWPESFVDEQNVKQNIYVLRRILGDDQNGNSFIQTVPRRGYKFIAPVIELNAPVAESLAAQEPPAVERQYWRRHSPFRSLQVFEPEDAWLFFGRSSEIEELRDCLGRSPLLALIGNSGSGKSSLLRAGLIPTLQAGRSIPSIPSSDCWRIAFFRPSSAPFDYLAEVLSNQLAPELSLSEKTEFISDCRKKLAGGGEALRDAISVLVHPSNEGTRQNRVLLVADQFEEIFTLTPNRETRYRYIEALLAAARWDGPVPVHVILALRSDFYSHCLEHTGLSRSLAANLYNVPRMMQNQLRETIEKRLQITAAQAEPGLIDALLDDAGDEPGNLALQEHALGQLWEKCGGIGATLTNSAYSEIGRLRGALGRHADEVYESFNEAREKRLVERIFLELVQPGDGSNVQDTRRRVRKSELLSLDVAEEIEYLLARLAGSRLIATGREGENTYVEVSHEALIREWPRLRDWLHHSREELILQRRLREAAEEWAALDKDSGALLRGARLAQGEEWLTQTPDVLPIVRDFLQACIAARDEAQRTQLETQKREAIRQRSIAVRLRWSAFALAVLLLAAVGAIWYTYRIQLAEKSRTLAFHAVDMRDHDQGQALELALRAWRVARTDEARLAITKTYPQLVATLDHGNFVEAVAFSPDGQLILTTSDDQTAKLWRRIDGHLMTTLRGHTDKIISGKFSPDGQRIVTNSADNTVRVWSSGNGQLIATFRGHSGPVWSSEFSPDGQRIISASADKTAKVWNAADGRLLATFRGHADSVMRAQFSVDGRRIVTASSDHTARIWNGTDYTAIAILSGHKDAIAFVTFSPDGNRVLTASVDGTARVWDSADGRLLVILPHGAGVYGAAFSPDGRRIATAGVDHKGKVWNSSDGKLLAILDGHTDLVLHVTFSPDGDRILTDSTDATARVWNSLNGELLCTLNAPQQSAIKFQGYKLGVPWDSAFSPDGRLVIATLGDNAAHVWNVAAAGEAIAVLRGYGGAVFSAAFSPDGRRIVTAGADSRARVWSSDGSLLSTLKGHTDFVYEATFSPDGRRIVTVSGDKTARVWNSADGRLLAILSGHEDQVYRAQFSPDGERIVTASGDHTARIWDAIDGRPLIVLRGHNDLVGRVQFSPDGRRVVTASWDHTARVWDSKDGRLLLSLEGHTDKVRGAQFSPDGKRIVTFSWDHTARVWDSVDGRLLAILTGHTDRVWDARFSPDGQRIVTASQDYTARVWNANNYALLNVLAGHSAGLMYATFSPDGQRILTASEDGTARAWESADGRPILTLQGHANLIYSATFSPDGQQIVTAGYDQTARIWRIVTLDDIRQALAN